MFLNNEIFLELPNELINDIIKYLPPNPVALIIKPHIHNLKLTGFKTEWRWGNDYFYKAFFTVRKASINSYDYALNHALLKIKKIEFIKKNV